MKSKQYIFAIWLLASCLFSVAKAQDEVDFGSQVRPLLSDRCFHCHGPDADNQESDYRMDSEEALLEQIEKHDIDASELYQRIISEDPDELMPPPDSNRALSDDEKEIIRRWIEQGAPYEGHWAFQMPDRPEVPELDEAEQAGWSSEMIAKWSGNPIDAFIARRLIKENLKPAPPADWETKVRRASLTLAGMLPSEIPAPGSEGSDNEYQILIEQILRSDGYAERQTLRWLDAARYADTDGYQVDSERQNWPWRDWVIKAYRDNMPFDQFVIEQIAGDMMENATYSQQLASAFNRNHRQNAEGGALAEEFLVENIIDRVETTSTVFLGLTFGCSRCHDHKYDPLTQEEFFQMYGYFNNIGENPIAKGLVASPTMLSGSPLREVDDEFLTRVIETEEDYRNGNSAYQKRLQSWSNDMTELVKRIDEAKEKEQSSEGEGNSEAADSKEAIDAEQTAKGDEEGKSAGKQPESEDSESALKASGPDPEELRKFEKLGDELQKILRKPDNKRNRSEKNKLDRYFAKIDPEWSKLVAARNKARKEFSKRGGPLATVMVMKESRGKPKPFYVLDRGQYNAPLKKKPLTRGVPQVLLPEGVAQPSNRYEFAKWLVSRDNPLTARVIVNRMWRDHFGTGLVKTVDDFGVQGEIPSHPELLDWLAVEFIESGWNVRAMQRLIVTSQAYQQSSKMTPEMLEMDPENRLLARGPRYRADGFMIRDLALQSAGLLNTRLGGPPVKPYQPDGLWEVVAANKGTRYVPSKGDNLYRKSVYSFWKRAVNPPRQTIFDAGGREVCSVQVRRTNTPLQALVMLNDQTFVEAARVMAGTALESDGTRSARDQIRTIYSQTIGRNIDERSLDILMEGLEVFREHFRNNTEAAEQLLTVGEYQKDREIDTIEHAAMTMVAHMIMNLDEFITIE